MYDSASRTFHWNSRHGAYIYSLHREHADLGRRHVAERLYNMLPHNSTLTIRFMHLVRRPGFDGQRYSRVHTTQKDMTNFPPCGLLLDVEFVELVISWRLYLTEMKNNIDHLILIDSENNITTIWMLLLQLGKLYAFIQSFPSILPQSSIRNVVSSWLVLQILFCWLWKSWTGFYIKAMQCLKSWCVPVAMLLIRRRCSIIDWGEIRMVKRHNR